ncbi:unnamed protein product [Periconia digitata]|uniref:Nephrocystin 3-like N-terminal domain-containing protein n=1 Tax=Periconia digitata TaxID=1303443 RepID=A0A9W4UFA0_9PLEO|nr:unnamed protein product [Periconia digitata]
MCGSIGPQQSHLPPSAEGHVSPLSFLCNGSARDDPPHYSFYTYVNSQLVCRDATVIRNVVREDILMSGHASRSLQYHNVWLLRVGPAPLLSLKFFTSSIALHLTMEPLVAIGLVSNIFQLVEVGRHVATIANDIRRSHSGFSGEALRLRESAAIVKENLKKATSSSAQDTEQTEFHNYAKRMQICMDAYISKVENLREKQLNSRGPRYWTICKATITMWWKEAELREALEDIKAIESKITAHIIAVYVPAMNLSMKDFLEQGAQSDTDLLHKMEELRKLVQVNMDSADKTTAEIYKAIQDWFTRRENGKTQRRCLNKLCFPEIWSRCDLVADAHKKTFAWILESQDSLSEGQKESNFRKWLACKDRNANIFWVSGKPGAGKSTLMKFLANQEHRVLTHLQEWAGTRRIDLIKDYFWKQGSPIQQSLEGLLRSILFQILLNHPYMINIAFPGAEWLYGGSDVKFSVSSLKAALPRILEMAESRGIHFMFLIDGMDEFDDNPKPSKETGDPDELMKFLQQFRARLNVKVCVSSRPYNAFIEEFGKNQECWIRIENLTRDDIRAYIHEELEQKEIFRRLSHDDDTDYAELVREMIDSAQGVFLWVHLVLKDLSRALLDGAEFTGLQEHLRRMPQELEDLYRHLLASPRLLANDDAIMLLLSMIHLAETRPNLELGTPPLIHAFMNPRRIEPHMRENKCSLDYFEKLHDKMIRLANAYFAGLLDYCPWPRYNPERRLFASGFVFSHRTVWDYLSRKATVAHLYAKIDYTWDDFETCFLHGLIVTLQMSICLCSEKAYHDGIYDLWQLVGLTTYQLLENIDPDRDWNLIKHLNSLICARIPNNDEWSSLLALMMMRIDHKDLCTTHDDSFTFDHVIYYVACFDKNEWILQRLLREEPGLAASASRLMYLTCMRRVLKMERMQILFDAGANPNQDFKGVTPWKQILVTAYQNINRCVKRDGEFSEEDLPLLHRVGAILELFLRRGVDVGGSCALICGPTGMPASIRISRGQLSEWDVKFTAPTKSLFYDIVRRFRRSNTEPSGLNSVDLAELENGQVEDIADIVERARNIFWEERRKKLKEKKEQCG